MKRSKAYVNNRRDQIVAILEKDGKASVADLAERFGVSPLTIRRDLDFLEERKVLSREYGTAKLLNPMGRPSGSRQIRAITAISRLAARYVDDGDLILINTSATAIAMLDHIEAQDVTCMTNMGKAILLESVRPNVSLMLTGGEIRPPRTSLTGHQLHRQGNGREVFPRLHRPFRRIRPHVGHVSRARGQRDDAREVQVPRDSGRLLEARGNLELPVRLCGRD